MVLYDRVCSKITQNLLFKEFIIAIGCLYLCCKFTDPKYLHITSILHAITLTKVGPQRSTEISIGQDAFLAVELSIMEASGFSLSSAEVVSPLDFYSKYFCISEGYYLTVLSPSLVIKLKFFGQFLLHISLLYPSSFYRIGPDVVSAACLFLAQKVFALPCCWCIYQETLSGFSKQSLKQAALKICTKYIDLVVNNSQQKERRLFLARIKYEQDKYHAAATVRPQI